MLSLFGLAIHVLYQLTLGIDSVSLYASQAVYNNDLKLAALPHASLLWKELVAVESFDIEFLPLCNKI